MVNKNSKSSKDSKQLSKQEACLECAKQVINLIDNYPFPDSTDFKNTGNKLFNICAIVLKVNAYS